MNDRLNTVAIALIIICSLLKSTDCYRRPGYTIAYVNVTWISKNVVYTKYYSDKFYYGRESDVKASEGNLIAAVVPVGCLATNYAPTRQHEKWIALVSRGSCYFNQKIDSAKKMNASGIIIYDNTDNQQLIMSDKKIANFISISTSRAIGNELLRVMKNATQIYVRITVGPTVDNWDFNRTSIFFVSVSFIIFMVVSLGWLLVYYFQRFRYLKNRQRNQV